MTTGKKKIPGGFFMLNTQRASKLHHTIRSGEARWIFLILSLRAWGWDARRGRPGDGTTRASISFVAEAVGVSRNSADKYLRELIEAKLIWAKEKAIDGTVWCVSPLLARGGEGGDERQFSLVLEGSASQNLGRGYPKIWDGGIPKFEQGSSQVLGRIVDSRFLDSLSPWNEFVASLPERQRERADRVLQELNQKFPNDPVEEIQEAPRNLARFGAPDGQPVKSPLGLIETSWPQLRDYFRSKSAQAKRTEAGKQAAQAAADRQAATDDEWIRRKQEFLDAFPDADERRQVIQSYTRGASLDPDGPIALATAVKRWSDTERAEAALAVAH